MLAGMAARAFGHAGIGMPGHGTRAQSHRRL